MNRKAAREYLQKIAGRDSILGRFASEALNRGKVNPAEPCGMWLGTLHKELGLRRGQSYGIIAVAQRLQAHPWLGRTDV